TSTVLKQTKNSDYVDK
ncbi:23S rRNA methyltransferase attenuation leader peptide, partial [Streptococcus pneumoniae]|nr:23S rRNA methyltransferase attenuation leader peptide [Streptococcus pneumoniae]